MPILTNTSLNRYISLHSIYPRIAKWLLNAFLLIIIFAAVYTSFKMNIGDRSLFLDEAMLAYSFSERSIFNLTSDIFDWNQSAPILYLYIVKIITLLFGNSEFTLRLFSFISFIILLLSAFYIQKRILKVKLPLLGTAFIASMKILLMYSNEFKPYMSDCTSILLTIIFYYLYTQKRINTYTFISLLIILLLISNPSCFFIGACLFVEFIDSCIKKDNKRIMTTIAIGVVILFSFFIYYLYWLKPVIDAGEMAEFWKEKHFPLIPLQIADIYKQKTLVLEIIRHLGIYQYLILAITIIGFFINILYKKNNIINAIYIGIFITLFVSMIEMYPIQDRLYLFFYPIIAILLFYCINELFNNNMTTNIVAITVSLILILSMDGIRFYSYKENLYRESEEINMAYDFIEKKIDSNESLYIYYHSIPGFFYRNKFDLTHINGNRNIILGNKIFNDSFLQSQDVHNNILQDILKIEENSPTYILTSHVYPLLFHRIEPILDSLNNKGDLSLVYDRYGTYIYYYTQTKHCIK